MPFPVTVHPFPSPTSESCAYERGLINAQNALVFISGLTAGPHSTDEKLMRRIEEGVAQHGYGVWEFRMRSSYDGFGFSSLANDVADLAALVTYLRGDGVGKKKKIVVVGCSTGCQDCMEYTDRIKYPDNPPVDGYILQSPVSDRETAAMFMPAEVIEQTLSAANELIAAGKGQDAVPKSMMPEVFAGPVTAYRWWSLVSAGGDDDYFSSDLPDSTIQKTFGRVDQPILIMPSAKDETVPPTVDKDALLKRWMSAVPEGRASGLSGVNPTGNHILSEAEGQEWFVDRVVKFLREIA